jgi:NADH-quinone oxidoreductase subunit L
MTQWLLDNGANPYANDFNGKLPYPGGNETFDFEIYFSEVFQRLKGFDIVIANPPYIGEKGHKEIFDPVHMGNLKKYMPVTFATMFIGTLAIAGIPPFSGFFSKDEILYETFHEGHTILWLVGAITSLLTATYMFRLVFMTFHGDPATTPHAAPSHAAPSHAAPSHVAPSHLAPSHSAPSHLHDAPPAMAFVLIVLALGSVLAGYIGVPHALGGHNQLAAWLAPSFQVVAAGGEAGGVDAAAAEAGEAAASAVALELTLMGVSSLIALAGIGFAALVWLKRRSIAENMARNYPVLHRLLLNKYYVDEIYDAAIVQPIRLGSEQSLWRRLDVGVIDGAVNGTGTIVAAGAGLLRRLQTGSVRSYAGSMFVGVVVILGYYLWK